MLHRVDEVCVVCLYVFACVLVYFGGCGVWCVLLLGTQIVVLLSWTYVLGVRLLV